MKQLKVAPAAAASMADAPGRGFQYERPMNEPITNRSQHLL